MKLIIVVNGRLLDVDRVLRCFEGAEELFPEDGAHPSEKKLVSLNF